MTCRLNCIKINWKSRVQNNRALGRTFPLLKELVLISLPYLRRTQTDVHLSSWCLDKKRKKYDVRSTESFRVADNDEKTRQKQPHSGHVDATKLSTILLLQSRHSSRGYFFGGREEWVGGYFDWLGKNSINYFSKLGVKHFQLFLNWSQLLLIWISSFWTCFNAAIITTLYFLPPPTGYILLPAGVWRWRGKQCSRFVLKWFS